MGFSTVNHHLEVAVSQCGHQVPSHTALYLVLHLLWRILGRRCHRSMTCQVSTIQQPPVVPHAVVTVIGCRAGSFSRGNPCAPGETFGTIRSECETKKKHGSIFRCASQRWLGTAMMGDFKMLKHKVVKPRMNL